MQGADKRRRPGIGPNPEDLIEWYNKMLALYPRNIQVRCKLGWLLQKLGRYREAIAQWREVLKVDANNLVAREAILQISDHADKKKGNGETTFEGKAEN